MTAEPLPFEQRSEARLMLTRLFGTKQDDLCVVLFRLNPARSASYTEIEPASRAATGQADVYVHVGLSRKRFAGGDRPTVAEIGGIGGLWADIDIADPVHKRPGLPQDRDAALAVVRAMGLVPALVVHSGHGLQVWWPFAEVWAFDDDAERHRARVYARAWALTLKERARSLGYSVDMVSDIARVLRVPGTTNAKDPADVRPVTIIEQSPATISLDDVDGVLLDGAYEQAEREIAGKRASGDEIVYGDLVLDPQAEPPWDKLDMLRDVEPRADQAWRRKPSRRTEGWSSSEWDQSLATYAAQAGWSRQEIATLIIASRRKHRDDLKLRQDYFRMTIDKAMAGQIELESIREAVAVTTELAHTGLGESSETGRSDILIAISKSLGIEITRVIRSSSEPPVFGIETPHGAGDLGSVETIISNRKFRIKVAELTNRIPRKLKDELWEPIAQGLLQVAEPRDFGVETTLTGRAETLVSLYLGNTPPQAWAEMSEKTRDLLPIRMDPFSDGGSVFLFASGLRTWLVEHQHEQMSRTDVAAMLRAWGAEPESRHFGGSKNRTTRTLWRLPNP